MTLSPRVPKRWIVMGMGFALSGAALYYFLRRVDGEALLSSLVSANLWILSLCVFTKGAVLSLNAIRTKVLLLPIRRYRFVETFLPWLTGYVTDNLLPFRLGEIVRVDLLARAGHISRGSTVAIVGLDRLLDLLSLLVLLAIAAPILAIDLGRSDRLLVVAGVLVFAVGMALWLAARPTRLAGAVSLLSRPFGAKVQAWLVDKGHRFSDGLGALRSRSMALTVVGVTFLTRLVAMLTIQLWLWAFGLSLPVYAPLIVLLLISVGTMIPSSPGFVGTFHVACAYALELMGVEPAMAASVAIAGHFMGTVPWTVGGLFVSLQSVRRIWRQNRDSLAPAQSPVGA